MLPEYTFWLLIPKENYINQRGDLITVIFISRYPTFKIYRFRFWRTYLFVVCRSPETRINWKSIRMWTLRYENKNWSWQPVVFSLNCCELTSVTAVDVCTCMHEMTVWQVSMDPCVWKFSTVIGSKLYAQLLRVHPFLLSIVPVLFILLSRLLF